MFGAVPKSIFFNPSAVIDLAQKRQDAALAKIGAFIRRRAQTSIRYRKASSPPGSPPSAHRSSRYTRERTNKRTGAVTRQNASPLRDLIFFALDRGRRSVVIGPVVFGGSDSGGIAPRVLEEGGKSVFRSRRGSRAAHYRARPFMKPALAAETPRAVRMFRG